MATIEANSSWHPAFMPNSNAELISNNANETSELVQNHATAVASKIDQEDAKISAVKTPYSLLEAPSTDTEDHLIEDNQDHPELENLRDALTTSLASPGGVEMEDSPVHNGQSLDEHEPTEGTDIANHSKADIPTRGPAYVPGHSGSESFARTVPEDVNWGEDDTVDPEWNIRPEEKDPFESMGPSIRTNSFPQVPPAHLPDLHPPNQAPKQTHVEEITQQSQQPSDDFFNDDDDVEDSFFAQQNDADHAIDQSKDDVAIILPDKEYNELEKTFGDDSTQEADYEARYEEGVPLVGGMKSEPLSTEVIENDSGLFGDTNTNDEDDFFAGIGAGSTAQEVPPKLDRKSTGQVFKAMNFEPRKEHEDTELDSQEIDNDNTNFERVTGGGVAASKSTIFSQVFSNNDDSMLSLPEGTAASGEPSEEDLAAKWKAALDGDEFLGDDDDLLPDDDLEETNAVDPAAFFGSDDEGFLEDEDIVDNTSAFTPDPGAQGQPLAPVIGTNGQAIGFNSLTGSTHARKTSSSDRYLPSDAKIISQPQPSNPYAPPASPFITDLSAQGPTGTFRPYDVGQGGATSIPTIPYGSQAQQQRPELPKTQSFADKAKGGYASPYDLPMDVVKPRKRQSMQQMSRGYSNPANSNLPPPRSSSMQNQSSNQSRPTSSYNSPSSTSNTFHPPGQSQMARPNSQAAPPTLKSKASFFEELPMSSRPRHGTRPPSQPVSPTINNGPYGVVANDSPSMYPTPPSYPPSAQQIPQAPSSSHGLVAPAKANPYAPLHQTVVPAPPTTNRYSPAPVPQNQAAPPPAQGRYSAAPPPLQRPQIPASSNFNMPPPPVFAHQPRTSSPLAHFERSQDQRYQNGLDQRGHSSHGQASRTSSLSITREVDEPQSYGGSAPHQQQNYQTQPQEMAIPYQDNMQGSPSNSYQPNLSLSPSKRTTQGYAPENQVINPTQELAFAPPRRSQTQSPGRAVHLSHINMTLAEPTQRPMSVHGLTSPTKLPEAYTPASTTVQKPRTRGFSQGLNYVAPEDGREQDPLQRWKGCPVFAWGVGGTIVTSFPKEVPRYGLGNAVPMIVCSPGEVKIRNIKDLYPLEDRLGSFPGPLKGKSKKKDVLAWLTTGITLLEQETMNSQSLQNLADNDKRKEERVLLWKILRVLVEHDGILEGNESVNKAARDVLSPGLDTTSPETSEHYATGANIYQPVVSSVQAEAVDPAAVDVLRKHLLRGEREKAVWEAVDKRLWAHAMLISNTLSRDLYKRVAQEFIQKEVKGIGENTESLAALYEVLAGNFEEIVDELVPASARAGLQMVSTSAASGPSKSAVDGLDRWRETLSLVLSNRSPEDGQAISALGRLLSGYGRAEAAHICFLFARSHSVFGGIDDPLSNIVLLGSDHIRQSFDFDRELESVLLSEVYEYGLSLSASSNAPILAPHLAVYKLQHATILAEFGQRDKALQYCEAIVSSITSQTRRSPYHHPLLVAALDDLSKRLKQSPKDESSSWISKPSIDKVSGSVWAKFNKFVAGDENDAASNLPGAESGSDIGPFARIAGGTPTISRSPSNADIYGAYNIPPAVHGSIPIPSGSRTASRYAPGGSNTPNPYGQSTPSSYGSQPALPLGQGFSSYDPTRQEQNVYQPTSDPRVASPTNNLHSNHAPTSQGYGTSPVQISYAPNGQQQRQGSTYSISPSQTSFGAQNSYMAQSQTPPPAPNSIQEQSTPFMEHDSPRSRQGSDGPSYGAPSISYDIPTANAYTPPESGYEHPTMSAPVQSESGGYEPPTGTSYMPPENGGYEPPTTSAYMPPEDGGYTPPSYEPATMGDEPDSPIDTRPKKKSFMDDDEDDEGLKPKKVEKTKAEKDREADEAFRKAAEADAQKDGPSTAAKKGWGLGGWFGGGKKDSPAENTPAPNKPIKAKLGEASSFYYDPDLKRWVNKKAGKDDTPTPSSTPPPPRATPPRSASGPAMMTTTSAPRPTIPPSGGSMPPPKSTTTAGMQGPPGAAERLISEEQGFGPPSMSRSVSNGSVAAPPSRPPSRPNTSMSNASSIDDLLGPPTARKAGAKKAKKGRGYIDVMGDKSAS